LQPCTEEGNVRYIKPRTLKQCKHKVIIKT